MCKIWVISKENPKYGVSFTIHFIFTIFAPRFKTMNSVIIVLPILSLLMFDLGLQLTLADFALIAKRPKAMIVGLVGQIILLPLVAFALCKIFGLTGVLYVGMILIACCPGGSSSNIFSMLAKGDVALSVSLTALSSIITLFTLPLIMSFAIPLSGGDASATITLPVGNLLKQNLLLMFLPILVGIGVRKWWPETAQSIDKVLSKCDFPLLMLLAAIFFIQNKAQIADNITSLGLCVTSMLLITILLAALLSRVSRLDTREKRTIVIEVGMQNAAQAIAVAGSPFVFNNGAIAIPAIIYALMMNVVLLIYVGVIKSRKSK